jgi:hypothetical protein
VRQSGLKLDGLWQAVSYQHLEFNRVSRPPAARRRVKGRGGPRRYDNHADHADDVSRQADTAVDAFARRREQITDFDPKLILRLKLGARVSEEAFHRAGLTVLDSSSKDVSVVFASDVELRAFRQRLSEYREGPQIRPGRAEPGGAAYESFFDAIDDLGQLTREDRISDRLGAALDEDPASRAFDVECWYVTDGARLDDWMGEIRDRIISHDGEWLDDWVSHRAGVAVARCRGSAECIRAVAELDQVAIVDTIPQPLITRVDLNALQDIDDLEVADPPSEAPVLGIVDSGVRAGHPLIEPALAEATAISPSFSGQAEDDANHGTKVAGVALYGDVLASAQAGRFEPAFWIASVRVLDEDGNVPEETAFLRVISEAIEYLAETWETPVINLSIGDKESPYMGAKSTAMAAALDTLARRFDLVIVVSAGNILRDDLQPVGEVLPTYPRYLDAEGYEILDPAQAALALTVGAVSLSDGISPSSLGATRADEVCVATAGGPAPFTRHGPGAQGAIKPDLAGNGGNLVHSRNTQTTREDTGSAVVSTSGRFPSKLFEGAFGTSFAAPFIAYLCGRLAAEYELTSNTIRALLLQGADADDVDGCLGEHHPENEVEKRRLKLVGHGVPEWERVGVSQDNRVVLFAESELSVDDFHVYRIPMVDAYTQVSGPHELAVSLAYSPPVRHRRFDYLAFRMEFLVVRGGDLEEIYEMAGAAVEDPSGGKLADYEVPMRPPRTVRSRGANQAARMRSSQRPRKKFWDDWYIVVRSLNRWLGSEEPPQPYSLAVAIGAERAENLFVELEARLEAELQAQATVGQ